MPGPSEAEINAHWWQAAARALAEAPPEAREQLRRLFAADFQEPENYNPAMADYHGREAQGADRDWYRMMLSAGMAAPLSAIAFAGARSPYGGRAARMIEGTFGTGFGALTAGSLGAAHRVAQRGAEHRRHQADYEAGGRAFTPEELAEMFRPRPPMSR